MSSLYRIARTFSRKFYSTCRSYPLVQASWRHNQQYLNFAPSNHIRTFIDSQNKGFEFSSWAFNGEITVAAKSNDNAEESDSEQEQEEEEDMVKLVSEKDELLMLKQKEIENMKDKILRTLAETENVKERTRREADNTKKFAIQNFAKGLLDVADNLSRASSVVKESFSKIDESNNVNSSGAITLVKTLLEGVEMTEKQLAEVLRKSGVEKFEAINEQFDPNRHNAVFQVPDASKPPGTVAIVLKVGYMLHDRVLRAAEVGVTIADVDQGTK
ncbi:grpE protein homolog 2, mitochondrial-like [Impatiens glandulifera]|uniref:grpE protein homolog 2, mitochondrial-like n=1 Tax=Impatiens glandulifera TaxID=253017 RepID=UPI001FB1364E|nr:grpE protein homolog 2, mitochondrial-like [Impatiens glandulifera]